MINFADSTDAFHLLLSKFITIQPGVQLTTVLLQNHEGHVIGCELSILNKFISTFDIIMIN